MSDRATAWARTMKCGSPGRKLVLCTIASHMSPHDGEADGLHSGYPSQELLIDECEMSERALRDHLNELVLLGYIQRKKRYKFSGERTSDWYRLPVHNRGDLGAFPQPETHETPKEWHPYELPAISADSQPDVAADSAGSDDSGGTTGRSGDDYRQPAAGKRNIFRKGSISSPRSNGEVVGEPGAVSEEEEIPIPKTPDPLSDDTLLMSTITGEQDAPFTPAELLASSLTWGDWGNPTPEQLKTLHAPIQRAFDMGWQPVDLRRYCNRAISRATTSPGHFLLGALAPERLPFPPKHEKPHTMSPGQGNAYEKPVVDPETTRRGAALVRKALQEQSRVRPSVVKEGASV